MSEFKRVDIKTVDMMEPLKREHIGVLLATGDRLANRFGAELRLQDKPVDLSDAVVTGYFINPECETVLCEGVVEGSTVYVDLPASCYTQSGSFSLAIKVSSTEVTGTVRVIDGVVRLTQTDTLVDPGEVVPSVDELLAIVADIKGGGTSAPAIVQEVTGEVATCTDAAERDALHAVSYITAVQEGENEPSPDNIRPITGRVAAGLWHGAEYDASAAGTMSADLPEAVYGGTLDWVTGVLTITHKLAELTGSSGWTAGTRNFFLPIKDKSENPPTACSQYVYTTASTNKLSPGEMGQANNKINIAFANPDNALTLDEWKAQCDATPIQLLYEMAEARTVQLDPRTLTMLKGSNALWSDTGDTTLTYIADTKMYIDASVPTYTVAEGVAF